jgi:hypothetical protein
LPATKDYAKVNPAHFPTSEILAFSLTPASIAAAMLPGLLFAIWRSFEIFTLLPVVGMLSWFVHGYTTENELTPTFILVLFIVSVIALVWAIATILAYGATKYNGRFVAFVDLLIIGGLIAGVYELRGITDENCAHFGQGTPHYIYLNLGIFGSIGAAQQSPWALHLNKNCSMLKASFALAIMNILFFAVTFVSFFASIKFAQFKVLVKSVANSFFYSSSLSGSPTTTAAKSVTAPAPYVATLIAAITPRAALAAPTIAITAHVGLTSKSKKAS